MNEDLRSGGRGIALVGRPNVGKTSMLMHLTGTKQNPVNFPGTSVERVESVLHQAGRTLRIIDLPGIVSLLPMSPDERVTIDYLRDQQTRPDGLCVVIDASKLPVELRFLQQLRGLSLPIVVALSKLDVAEAEGRPIAVEALKRALGLPLFVVNGYSGAGTGLLQAALLAMPYESSAAPVVSPSAEGLFGAAVLPSQKRNRTDAIDAVLLHRVVGPLVLLLLIFCMFQLVFTVATPFMSFIEAAQSLASQAVTSWLAEGALQSFVVDGLVNGVGSAFVFVPQIALLIAFVTLLEGTGYMARAVFLLDRLLSRFGLTGRSFVPLTSSFACAIPGILASRIIADERDRIATIVVAPLMSCSARLPVYVVLLAAFFPPQQAGLLLLLLYLLGIFAAIFVAMLLRRTVLSGGRSQLLMELPSYQWPSLRIVVRQVSSSVQQFLRAAGSVILIATVVIWSLSYFPRPVSVHTGFEAGRQSLPAGPLREALLEKSYAEEQAAYLEQSWLAHIGKAIQPVFAPAGFDWRQTVGILAAFPARELVIPTLGTLYSLSAIEADRDSADPRLLTQLREAVDANGKTTMNSLVALSLMAFFALCSQCVGTLAAIRRETHGFGWPVFTFCYMTALAWGTAVAIYQIGSWLGYGLSI
ncbi:ferrous iron transporter B [Planctomycetota bacterium]|nr:ferrous iron transporter B [Planctomycetota bacterium]